MNKKYYDGLDKSTKVCEEIAFDFVKYIKKELNYTITEDFEVYWELNSEKFFFEIDLLSEVNSDFNLKDQFIKTSNKFFEDNFSKFDRDYVGYYIRYHILP